MIKNILALDLGVASIGWALIEDNNGKQKILGIGSRIIDFENAEASNFGNGSSISKNAERTKARTARKCYDRYILRRTALTNFFRNHDMLPNEDLIKLDSLSLWGLRARAVNEKVSLPELARILYHLNQKRGYKSVKGDTDDSSMRAYVTEIYERNKVIHNDNLTIGQFFFKKLSENISYRCKNQIFPRSAYVEEFDKIINTQRIYYPTILTDDNITLLRDRIIYYQRNLKSCKHLVSFCELELKEYTKENGQTIKCGPRVAHLSNPLTQICHIWESINNINIKDFFGNSLNIDIDKKEKIFNHLNYNKNITVSQLAKLLSIKAENYDIDKNTISNLKGNSTFIQLLSVSKKDNKIINIIANFINTLLVEKIDKETGEITKIVNPDFEKSDLYQLWHTIYSIPEKDIIKRILKQKFSITDETKLEALASIDFAKQGYSKKSTKAINRILPYLMDGYNYYESKLLAGYNDTPLTKTENESRVLLEKLPLLEKNSLRQPLVEKILNQMINLVNALMVQYNCHFNEIRIELARDLKQSKEERQQTSTRNLENKKINDACVSKINELNITPSKSKVEKYRLAQETNNRCIYCNEHFELNDFLLGIGYEIEHIIPKSIIFDNSFSNKVCSCTECNKKKGNNTAYDFMKNGHTEAAFNDYISRVNTLYNNHQISKAKRNNLLTPIENVSNNFINRQLRQTQYISKMACKILNSVCYNVTTSTGSITDYLRRIWGWKNVLEDLNRDRFRLAGLTQSIEVKHKDSVIKKEVITDWSKRKDHRHHAIDALVIACTPQRFIQRLNELSTLDDVPFESIKHQSKEQKDRYSKLDKYAISLPHFSYNEVKKAVDGILVSFKSTRKVATPGKRYTYSHKNKQLAQSNLLIPRGQLCEGSVYGKINHNGTDEIVIKYKVGIGQGYLFSKNKLTQDQIEKVLDSIVDSKIKSSIRQHLESHKYKLSECFKEVLYCNNRPVYSVRCLTGLKAVYPARINLDGSITGYVKSSSTHNITIYKKSNGDYYENACTFWHAVERKRYQIPVIIKDTDKVWDFVFNTPNVSEEFVKQLPQQNSEFIVSIQRDDMFVLDMEDDEFKDAITDHNMVAISKHLYKVQNASSGNYRFCLHTLTEFELKRANGIDQRFINIQSIAAFLKKKPHKVRIDILGNIKFDDI